MDTFHSIWRKVRGPFFITRCKSHVWEVYNCDAGGCLHCGIQHKCGPHCPTLTEDDGEIGCTITGLCVPSIRCAPEYSENYIPVRDCDVKSKSTRTNVYQNVLQTVREFLDSDITKHAVRHETELKLNTAELALIRIVKDFKSSNKGGRLCIPDAIACILNRVNLQHRKHAVEPLVLWCSGILTKCIEDLMKHQSNCTQLTSRGFIAGLLYLMRHGLILHDQVWLPQVAVLHASLPHENQLRTKFKLSPKIICETENEVKCILRNRLGQN